MEHGLASLGPIFFILKSFNRNAVFSIVLGLPIRHNFFVTSHTSNFHSRPFEVFLVMGLLWIVPVIAPIAIDFSDHLDDQWVVGRVMRSWWRR